MIKGLFFAASTLLFPCLAFGGNPSTDLSVQVVTPPPSGTTPPVPTGAAAAGFTTLALNTDWEHQQFPLNWLGACPNGSIPVNADNGQGERPLVPYGHDDTGHTWWANLWWSYGSTGCTYVIVSDPVFGNTALDLAYTNRNNSRDGIGNVIQTASADYNRSTGVGQVNSFPIGSYYEITYRITPAGDARNYIVLNTWGPDGIANGNCNCAMEWDVMETDGSDLGKYDSAFHNWGAGGGGWVLAPWSTLAPGTNFDPNNYNTIGMRVTYDGAHMIGCTYVNNVFQQCSALQSVNATEAAPSGRNFLVLQKACDTWNGSCTQDTQHGYIKSVRVWSCASWQTTQCTGQVLNSAP